MNSIFQREGKVLIFYIFENFTCDRCIKIHISCLKICHILFLDKYSILKILFRIFLFAYQNGGCMSLLLSSLTISRRCTLGMIWRVEGAPQFRAFLGWLSSFHTLLVFRFTSKMKGLKVTFYFSIRIGLCWEILC